MVKEFEDSQENTLVITFDSRHDVGYGKDTALEYSIKLAASVAGYAMERGGNVRLLSGRLSSQEVPWTTLLKELALLEAGEGPGLTALVQSIPEGARVLALVSETDSPGIEALCRGAGRMSGLVVVLLEGFGEHSAQGAGQAEMLARAGGPGDELPPRRPGGGPPLSGAGGVDCRPRGSVGEGRKLGATPALNRANEMRRRNVRLLPFPSKLGLSRFFSSKPESTDGQGWTG